MIDKIVERIDQMTPANQKIAQFVLKYKEEVGFLSISELSKRVGTSQASLVRFAKKLNFNGFNDFKKAIQEEIRRQLSPYDKTLFTDLGLRPEEDQLTRLAENELNNLEKTFSDLDIRKVIRIAQGVQESRQLFICGFGGSAFLAGKFVHSLQIILEKQVILISGSISDYTPGISTLAETDTVIIITLPTYSKESLHIADLAEDTGAALYLFTDSARCPIYSKAHEIILCRNESLVLANSYTSVLALIQILVDMIFLNIPEEGVRSIKKINEIESIGYEKFSHIKSKKTSPRENSLGKTIE